MSRFLTVISVGEAVAAAERIAPSPQAEQVPVAESAGRVLVAEIQSDTDIPGFDRSVVDGFAVRSADTAGAGDSIPALLRCVGRVAMGKYDDALSIGTAECAYIPTGGVLPKGADAAVMVEYTEGAGDTVLIKNPPRMARILSGRMRTSVPVRRFFLPGGGSPRRTPGSSLPAGMQP
jgi:molybdopterin molybdotransferase